MTGSNDRGRRGSAAAWLAAAPPARWSRGAQHLGFATWMQAQLALQLDGRRLFLWSPVAFGLGILLFFGADGVPSPVPPIACAVALAAAAVALRHTDFALALALAGCLAMAGFACAAWRTEALIQPRVQSTRILAVEGFVETINPASASARATLLVTRFADHAAADSPRRLRVTFRGRPAVTAGEHILVTVRLTPPPQPVLPGGYDFARDAFFQEIGGVGRVLGTARLSAAPFAPDAALRARAAIDRARNVLTDRIATAIGGQAGAFAAALVTGKRGLIDDATNEALRGAGLYHIVSISGLHMAIAAGMFFWATRALLALVPLFALGWPIKKLAAFAAMAGATVYCVFSGAEVATVRALVMTLVMMGAVLVDRPAISMRNLAIAALVVLALTPEALIGPSFQMSFAAVMALIAAHEAWQRSHLRSSVLFQRDAWPGPVVWVVGASVASLATTLVAGLATAPFSAFHFFRLDPYGMIGNALAIPFVSLIVMPAAALGVALAPFGWDLPIWWLMGQGSGAVLWVAALVSGWDGAGRTVPAFGFPALALISFAGLWLCLWVGALRLVGLALIIPAAILIAQRTAPDLLIDRDGRQVAFRGEDGHLHIVGSRPSQFTTQQWLASDGRRAAVAPATKSGCDPLGCIAQLADGRFLALVTDRRAFTEDCRRAAVLVTPLSAPLSCSGPSLIFDAARLATYGATRVHLGRDGTIHLERANRADKPWAVPPATAPPALPQPEVAARPDPEPDEEALSDQ